MNPRELLSRYFLKGLLVDTNILLLYFVGKTNINRIQKFKRTEQFDPDDYKLLDNILAKFSKIVTTPNILTEVSNFLNQLGEPERNISLDIFAQSLSILDEHYISSEEVIKFSAFTRFGLTDSAIASFPKNQYLVLTDDLKLAIYLQSQDINTVNFNNLRTYNWGI